MPPRVVLIGLRASGKSTLGRLLAERLGVGFVDLDDRTAARLGAPSAGAGLRAAGEAAFREAEAGALEEALRAGGVVALGGGTPLAPGAADALRACGAPIVYLHASVEELESRLSSSDLATRPSLTGAGTVGEVGGVYAARDPLFRSLSTVVVDTGDRDARRVLSELERAAGSGEA